MARKNVDNTPTRLCPSDTDSSLSRFTFDLTSCKYGKLCSQFPECMSFLAPSQTTPQANFKDDGFCASIFAVSIYLRAGRSFAVRGGGIANLRKLRIFSNLPPPQIHHSFLEMTNLILSCPPPNKFYPPPPAYCSYKSC